MTLRLRSWLALVSLASALPVFALAALLAINLTSAQVTVRERDVIAVTNALSLAIDSEIGVYRTALEALGRSRLLAQEDLAAFHAQMVEAAALLD
ncbi:MAG TPA: hypothetical protein VGC80_12540, partial [Acetobacteraceae bacterium]